MVKSIKEIIKETVCAILALLVISLVEEVFGVFGNDMVLHYENWDIITIKSIIFFGVMTGVNTWCIRQMVTEIKREEENK